MLSLSLTIPEALVEGMGFRAQYVGAHGDHPKTLLRSPGFDRTHQCASDTSASGRSADQEPGDFRSWTDLQSKVRSYGNPAQQRRLRARSHEHEVASARE